MKKYSLFILVTASLITGCTPREKKLRPIQYEPYVEYYENGSLKSKGFFDAISGNREGNWEYYLSNNGIKARGSYKAGSKTGMWEYFNPPKKIFWLIYTDTSLNIDVNIPASFQVFPKYKSTNILAAFDSLQTDSFHVNFNVSKYRVKDNSTIHQRVNEIYGQPLTNSRTLLINGQEALLNYSKVTNEGITLHLSQAFINSEHYLYLLNYFDVKADDELFREIAFSVKLRK